MADPQSHNPQVLKSELHEAMLAPLEAITEFDAAQKALWEADTRARTAEEELYDIVDIEPWRPPAGFTLAQYGVKLSAIQANTGAGSQSWRRLASVPAQTSIVEPDTGRSDGSLVFYGDSVLSLGAESSTRPGRLTIPRLFVVSCVKIDSVQVQALPRSRDASDYTIKGVAALRAPFAIDSLRIVRTPTTRH